MTKLIVVTAGEWSAFNLVGVFSSQALAAKAMLKYPPGMAGAEEIEVDDQEILDERLIYQFNTKEKSGSEINVVDNPWPSSMEIFNLDVVERFQEWNGTYDLDVHVSAKTYEEALNKATKLFDEFRANGS